MREVPGATDVEAEEAQGGWGFISCRKYYGFYYRPGTEMFRDSKSLKALY